MSEDLKKDNMFKKRFGRYLILDHLVDGGMAKICRARFLGEQADKIVAIKMVQPKYSADPSFKKMFMDEIKLTFGLIHPNIVQTYDYGLQDDQLYVAMEYCDGRNLKEYLEKLKRRKFVFPVEITVYIITQVCQALHYAHTHTDKLTGQKISIIHRDISPHNIMLTYDGAVKVIDFGIAKADNASNSDATQAGTIKGKLSYLAPEYLDGKKLDPRYDEFAVGITMWEMLCSRKLFKASNDLAVLKKIQECKVPPPSSINPNVPKELDDIVLKALKKDRNKRFENMDQLNRALIKFLYSTYPDFNSSDLSYFAKELFKDDIKKDREKLYSFGKIDLSPYIEEMKNDSMGSGSDQEDGVPKAKQREVSFDFGFDEDNKSGRLAAKTQTKAMPAQVNGAGGATSKMELGGASSSTKTLGRQERTMVHESKTRSAEHRPRRKTSTRQHEELSNDRPRNNLMTLVAGVAALAVVKFLNLGAPQALQGTPACYLLDCHSKRDLASEKDKQPVGTTGTEVIEKQGNKKGELYLKGIDKYKDKVYVDGEQVKVDILGNIILPIGKEVVLRVQKPRRQYYVRNYVLVENGETLKIPELPLERFGYLITSRECAQGKLTFELYGEKRVEHFPIKSSRGIAFPIKDRKPASQYQIKYSFLDEDVERVLEFSLAEDDYIDLCDLI